SPPPPACRNAACRIRAYSAPMRWTNATCALGQEGTSMADPRPWLAHYPPGVPAEIDADAYPSIVAMFEVACAKHPGRPSYSSFGKSMTYAELDQASAHFAAFLANEWKLGKGDRLAIMIPNLLQYPIALFGAPRAGLAVVNVNP